MTRWRAVGELLPGDPERVAGYRIEGRLGEGGMGVVYLAEHPEKGWAALKFLHGANAGDATFRERFRREVEAANRVRSPRVAALFDADLDAATPWLATAFVDGPTLAEAVTEGGPMEADRIVALAAALADALASIHASGVVHRDLKPANILLTPDTPVVIDFGIASAREAPALTRTGMSIGTPGWMAPEQVRGRRAGPHTDVFAWGLVVAFAGSGRPPFGRGPADVLYYRVVHQRPHLPALPEPLGELVAAALTKDPRRRPTVADLLARLGAGVAPSPDPVDPTTTGPVPTLVAAGWGPEALPPAHPTAATALVADPAVGEAGAVPGAPATGVTQVDPSARGAGGGPARPEVGPDDATHLTHLDPSAAGAAGAAAGAAGVAVPPGPTGVTHVVPGAPGADADGRTVVGARPAPTFWYGGAEHDSPVTLAAALQQSWDDAVDQVFVRRSPVWIAELQAFLDARGLAEAERIVAYGQGTAPAGAAMARLLAALDPDLEPRFGGILLTPAGLAAAADAVVAGHGPAARLAEVHDCHVLRLWRTLPGLDEAAAIDERWQAHTQAFDRLAAEVRADAGEPTPADRHQAVARLLLHALGGRHARQQHRRLRSAQKTAASEVTWWQRLANRGGAVPAAAVLAVMTVDTARPAGEAIRRRNAEAAAAEAARRAAAPGPHAPPPPWAGGPPAGPAGRPAPPVTAERWSPRKKAHGLVRRPFGLSVVVAVLGFHLWAVPYLRDELRLYFRSDPVSRLDRSLEALDEIERGMPFVLLALLAAVGMHMAGRWADRGQHSGAVRLYALGAAATDAFVALALLATCWFAAMVVQVAVSAPFADPLPSQLIRPAWAGIGVTHGVVFVLALWVLARAVVRGLRALLGGAVAQRTR